MQGRVTRATLTAVCATALLVTPQPLAAQQPARAFESLRLDLSVVANINRTTFHDYWSPNPGLELGIATPFYLGAVEAGLQFGSFDALNPEQPDFDSFFPFLGWGYDLPAPSRLGWYNGVRLGSMLMNFDTRQGGRTEQEVGIELCSRLLYGVLDGWSIELSLRYRVVFTHERLRLLFVAGGISRAFATPRWLKEFLE